MTSVTIAKVHALDIDTSLFNEQIREYIWNYGLKQILNDAGSAGKSADEKLGMAQKKLTALYEGIIRKTREGKNPVEAMRLKVAKEMFKAIYGTGKGLAVAKLAQDMAKRELADFNLDDEDEREVAVEIMVEFIAEKSAKCHEVAAERLAQVKPTVEMDF